MWSGEDHLIAHVHIGRIALPERGPSLAKLERTKYLMLFQVYMSSMSSYKSVPSYLANFIHFEFRLFCLDKLF